MTYTISSSEKTNEKASEYETRAMLYLMNFHKGCDDIKFFVVDFFNDLTGVDAHASKAIDLQSKSSKKLTGSKLGAFLVTLYKNYLSNLPFVDYVLFVGGINEAGLVDNKQTMFNINNFQPKYKDAIKNGLKAEALSKSYIDNDRVTDSDIANFVEKVFFVIDRKTKSDYIREIIKFNSSVIISDDYLERIFDEIRDRQSSKKNICCEGITINCLRDFHGYKKYLTSEEIKTLVLSRIVSRESMKEAVPTSFLCVLEGYCESDKKELLDECRSAISRMLFNRNNARAYWSLFESIYYNIKTNPYLSIDEIYNGLDIESLSTVPELDFNSARFFIALIKDSIS